MIRAHLVRRAAALAVSCILTGAVQAGTITGRLTDAVTGAPIVGAHVNLHGPGGAGFALPTDIDGRYISPVLAAGDWRVLTVTPEHLDELFDNLPCEGGACYPLGGTPVAVTDGSMAVADFALVPGGAIAGRISGPGNLPLANTPLWVRGSSGQFVASVNTDAQGQYRTLRSLAPGSYTVSTANLHGLVDEAYPDLPCPGGAGCDLQNATWVSVTAGSVATDIDLQLAPGATLSGQVTAADGGAPLISTVQLYRDGVMMPVIAFSAADGSWQSPALPAGTWRLAIDRSDVWLGLNWPGIDCDNDCLPAHGPGVQLEAADITGIDFSLETGSRLSGTVTSANGGAPVPDAIVFVRDPVRGVLAFGYSQPDGTYTSQPFLSGSVKITADARNFLLAAYGEACEPYCSNDSGVLVSPPLGVSGGYDFALQVGGTVEGLVTGPDGPLAGVQVHVVRSDGELAHLTYTQADGRYSTAGTLADGQYRVRTSNVQGLVDEAWPNTPCVAATCPFKLGDLVTVERGQSTVANFTLAAGGRIAGQVRRAENGAPVAMPRLLLIDSAGIHVDFGGGPDGFYETPTGLPPGTYYLAAFSSDGSLLPEAWQEQPCSTNCQLTSTTPIVLAGDEVLDDIDFTLEAGAFVTGTVTDAASGAPLVNAQVRVIDAQTERSLGFGFSNIDGSYRTSVFAPGTVKLLASVNGYVDAIPAGGICQGACGPEDSPPLQLTAGEYPGIDFTMKRGSRMAGHVFDKHGAPVGSVNVFAGSDDAFVQTVTDADGSYRFDGLPSGRYYVFADMVGEYIATAWPSTPCVILCDHTTRDTVAVGETDEIAGIDIVMLEGGRLRGRVEGMPGNLPQAGIVAFNDAQTSLQVGVVDLTDGEYLSTPLPPGDYWVYTGTTSGYIDELFDDVPCPYVCDESLATPVRVTSGQQTTVDFELARGGRIAGRIFNAGNNAAFTPRPAVQVRAADNTLVWSGMVAANGTYTTAALPSGTYYVRSRNRSGFLDEYYIDEECFWCVPVGGIDPSGQPATPTPVGVTQGAVTGGIDLGLVPGRRLSGRITVEPNGQAAPQVVVSAYDANGNFVSSVASDATGHWISSSGFMPGTYYLRTGNDGRYLDELFGGTGCAANCDVTQGTPVVVANADLGDLDFLLQVQPRMFRDGFE